MNNYPKCLTLKKFRTESGFSLEELAQLTELKPEWILGFESGDRVPWPHPKRTLAKFFGVAQTRLFPETRKPVTYPPTESIYPPCTELRAARMAAGLTQTKLGLMVGLSGAYISRFENGTVEPWGAAIASLCLVLKIHPVDLFPFLSQNPKKMLRVKAKMDKLQNG